MCLYSVKTWRKKWMKIKQECIPVKCIPSAAVAICWGVGVCLGGVCPGASAWGHLSGGVCLWGGGVFAQGGCLPRRGVHLPLWTDRHLWKHNLSATTVADGKNINYHGIVSSYVHEMLRCFSLVDVEPQSSLILISCKNKQPIYVITSSCDVVSCNVMLKTWYKYDYEKCSSLCSDAVVMATDGTVKVVIVKVSLNASKGSDVNDIT